MKPWVEFGILWGIAALNSPVLLSFLPASGLYAWYRRSKAGKKSIVGVALASLLFFACITPWLVRNYRVFGRPVFLRSNFGAELRMGNGPGANGTWMYILHPTQDNVQLERYRTMGELAYVEARKKEAWEWIKANPGEFVIVSIKRFVYYWYSVPKAYDNPWVAPLKEALFFFTSVMAFWGLARALRRRKPYAWLFFWLILCYPAVYYLVFPHARYRHPIDPEITILAVFLINEAEEAASCLRYARSGVGLKWASRALGKRVRFRLTKCRVFRLTRYGGADDSTAQNGNPIECNSRCDFGTYSFVGRGIWLR